ncbi:acyl-CoA dehydrogenase family protein [Cupriavidus basilensis]
MEALGRTLAPTPFFSTALLGASLISRCGSEAQKAKLLPAIAAGKHLTALAIDESRSAPAGAASAAWGAAGRWLRAQRRQGVRRRRAYRGYADRSGPH